MLEERTSSSEVPRGFTARCETIVDVLRLRAERTPDRKAFLFLEGGEHEGASFRFGQLERRARAVAARLAALKTRGRRVLLLHPPGLGFVESFFGCLTAGAVAVPGHSSLLTARGLARLRFIVRDAEVSAIVSTAAALSSFRQSLPGAELSRLPPLLASDEVADEEGFGLPPRAAGPDALAYIQYTSGSTSAPRGVPIRHGQLMHNQRMIRRAFRLDEGATAVSWLPHFHDMGLVGLVQQPVYSGFFTVMMAPLEFIRRPARWLRAISHYGARTSGAPNFAYDLCVERVTPEEAAALDLSRWERAFNGSEPVRAETLERFAARFAPSGFRVTSFYPCYGLAEATLFVSGGGARRPLMRPAPPARAGGAGASSEAARRVVSCGRARGAGRVVIADPETRVPLRAGEVGEVWVAGPHIAGGYWRRPKESLETFRAYLSETGDGPFLRTGDLGFIHGGELYVTGRLKDLIILRGKNHYPHDIEATVAASHTALRPNGGAAFSVEVEGLEELVVLQEVKSGTRAERAAEIRAAIRQSLAEGHAVKAHAVLLLRPNAIPRTSSGKVRRSACRDRSAEDAFRAEAFC